MLGVKRIIGTCSHCFGPVQSAEPATDFADPRVHTAMCLWCGGVPKFAYGPPIEIRDEPGKVLTASEARARQRDREWEYFDMVERTRQRGWY